jgi:hypothetical protein
MQGRDIHLAQDAQERGLLMLEQAYHVLDQLRDDPDLSETKGSPVDKPEISQVVTSGPEFIDIDEIVGLGDLEFMTSSVGLSASVANQPEKVWVSVETDTSNPLSEFIRIYDEEESLEVSIGTPVHFEEEKKPENTSSSIPEV